MVYYCVGDHFGISMCHLDIDWHEKRGHRDIPAAVVEGFFDLGLKASSSSHSRLVFFRTRLIWAEEHDEHPLTPFTRLEMAT